MSFSCPIPVHLIHDEITKNRQTPHPIWDVLRPLSKGRHFVKKDWDSGLQKRARECNL